MTEKKTVRLNKFIASAGLASRRGADDLVKQGKVTINGELADSPGIQVDPELDQVEVNGQMIERDSQANDIYIMLHKTIETVTTAKDPQGRKTVMDLLPPEIVKKRVFPVGRLDFYSEGLLLLTTDGELCNRMTHPKWHLPKIYDVTIRGELSEEEMSVFKAGMYLKGGDLLAPVKIKPIKQIGETTKYEMVLHQGVNRQIRRMFDEFNKTILRLKRVKQGRVELGGLQSGKWRRLSKKELTLLKEDLKMS